jgi:hypothetical protein
MMNRDQLGAYGAAERKTDELLVARRNSLFEANKMCHEVGVSFSSRAKIGLLCSRVLALVLQDVQECTYKQQEPRTEEKILSHIASVIEEVEADMEKKHREDDDFDTYSY